jgi:hypothetical protein
MNLDIFAIQELSPLLARQKSYKNQQEGSTCICICTSRFTSDNVGNVKCTRKIHVFTLFIKSNYLLHFIDVVRVLWEQRARRNIVVEALCYKPEGCGFETRRGELISSTGSLWCRQSQQSLNTLTPLSSVHLILPATLDPGVYSASNRN